MRAKNRKPALIPTLALLLLYLWAGSTLAQESLSKLVKRIQAAVVTIRAYDAHGKLCGLGSGFFISDQGDLITNYHVMKGAFLIVVDTADGESYVVKSILFKDISSDLGLLRVNIPRHKVLHLKIAGAKPEVGDRVIVIGSPLGLEQTVSDGLVSAIRSLPALGEILQISAPISPGSSGSPVVNLRGEVIGVAFLQIVKGQNLNFAIPANKVLALLIKAGVSLKEKEAAHMDLDILANNLFEEGRTLYKQEKFPEAIEKLKESIRINPNRAWAHYILGWAYNQVGQHQDAIEHFHQAIRLKKDYALAYDGLGWTYNQLGRHQEAVEACKQATKILFKFPDAHYNLGMAYLGIGNRDLAMKEYYILKNLNPEKASMLYDNIIKQP